MCNYRDNWSRLSALPCRWWGINQIKIETRRRFREERGVPFDLVSDPGGELIRALGMRSLFWVKRGFAVVSPEGKLIGTTAVNPIRYPKSEEVRTRLEPLLA